MDKKLRVFRSDGSLKMRRFAVLGALLLPLAAGCTGGSAPGEATRAAVEQALDNPGDITQREVLSPDSGVTNFGTSMGIHNNTVIVGGYGAAYVLKQTDSGWEEEQKLSESAGHFGKRVAISGDIVAVGADNAVYIYTRGAAGWSLQQKLEKSGPDFGANVALSGNTLLVAAPNWYEGTPYPGGTVHWYVREGSTWTEEGVLEPSSPHNLGLYGMGMAIEGDLAFVGAWLEGDKGAGRGYVFQRSSGTWTHLQTLDAWTYDNFGYSASILDGVLYVGVRGGVVSTSTAPVYSGIVRVYVRGQDGQFTEKLQNTYYPLLMPSNPVNQADYGTGLAVSMDTVLVGAPGINTVYVYSHSNYVYEEETKLEGTGDFGSAVVFTSTNALVGAPDDGSGTVTAFGPPQVIAENGSACAAAEDCDSGHCVEGVCCETECEDEGAASCGQTGACDAGGRCALYPEGTACSEPACESNSVARSGGTCDGSGSCEGAVETSCGDGAVCQGGACLTICQDSAECGGGVCGDDALCLLPQGSACAAAAECESGSCVDGYCCNAACTGNCESCAAPGSEGSCAIVATARDGSAEACDDFAGGCSGNADCPLGSTCSDEVCFVEPETGGSGGAGSGGGPASEGGSGNTGAAGSGQDPTGGRGGTSGGTSGSGDDGDDDSDDDDGWFWCSVGAPRQNSSSLPLALALTAALGVTLRRRRSPCRHPSSR
jgi:hypothetical protein